MIKQNIENIIKQSKPIYQKVIDKKFITSIYISHSVLGVIFLTLLIVGIALGNDVSNSIRLGLSITGLVVLCICVLTFYTFEFFRRKANMYFAKEFSLANVLDIVSNKQIAHNNSTNISSNQEMIAKYVSCQIIETYMTKEMDFVLANTNNTDFELGYFISSNHDIINHTNETKTNLFISKIFESEVDCYITNHELRENSYSYLEKDDNLFIYSNSKNIKLNPKLSKLVKSINNLNLDYFDLMICNGKATLILSKSNNYLMLGHKSYNFWKKLHPYLDNLLDKDVNEFNEIINYFV